MTNYLSFESQNVGEAIRLKVSAQCTMSVKLYICCKKNFQLNDKLFGTIIHELEGEIQCNTQVRLNMLDKFNVKYLQYGM